MTYQEEYAKAVTNPDGTPRTGADLMAGGFDLAAATQPKVGPVPARPDFSAPDTTATVNLDGTPKTGVDLIAAGFDQQDADRAGDAR